MILAVAAMFAWINEPFKLYGTGAIIIVTYVVLFIPICIKQILGGVNNIDPSLDFAAQTVGIRLMKRFNRIFMPQIKNSLIAGFIICFLISLKEIPISLLLYTTDTKTLGVMLFTIQSNSYGLEMTSTVSVVVIALSITGNIILRKFSSKGYNQYG
jgi:iron(III) transport system permease protein